MDEVLHVIAGSAAFLAVNLPLWGGAVAVAWAIPGSLTNADRVLATVCVAASQVVLLAGWLGFAGLLYPWVVGPASVAASLGLVAVFRVGLRRAVESWKARPWARFRDEPFAAAVLAPGAGAIALAFAYAVPRPPLGYDPLNYHLTISAHYLSSHDLSIFFFPPWFDIYSYLPANGDLFSIWLIMPFGCDFLLPLVNVPFILLMLGSLYAMARDLGCNRTTASAAASALATLPMLFMVATESYCEVPLWGLFLAGLRLAMIAARDGSLPCFGVATAACGLVAGMKPTGLSIAVVVFAAHALLLPGHGRAWRNVTVTALRHAGMLVVGLGALGSVFYLRNWLVSGDPVYPYPVGMFGMTLFEGQDGLDMRLASTTVAAHLDFLWESGRLVRAAIGETGTPSSSWGMGPTGIAACLCGALAGVTALVMSLVRRREAGWRPVAALAAAGAALVLLYVNTPYTGTFLAENVRFVYPAVAVLGLAAVGLATRLNAGTAAVIAVLLGLQATTFLFSDIPVTSGTGAGLAVTVGGVVSLASLTRSLRRLGWLSGTPSGGPARKALVLAGCAGIALGGLAHLHHLRERDRLASFREADRPNQLMVSRFAPCLEAVERALPVGRLAVAMNAGKTGFLFPLAGSHLEREIVYANIGEPDLRLQNLYARGDPRVNPDREAWLRNLDALAADALMVFAAGPGDPPVVESSWAREMPERFRLEFVSDECEVFTVTASR